MSYNIMQNVHITSYGKTAYNIGLTTQSHTHTRTDSVCVCMYIYIHTYYICISIFIFIPCLSVQCDLYCKGSRPEPAKSLGREGDALGQRRGTGSGFRVSGSGFSVLDLGVLGVYTLCVRRVRLGAHPTYRALASACNPAPTTPKFSTRV